ncbi:hypothetical protein E4K10_47180 [Streptomyces sp. T1317-0309]|nr:hypothetical protein E4K10_47180 [Streptomyces sp. T1317-0309]
MTVTVSGTKAISVGSNQHPTTINFQRFPNSRLLIFTARFGETGIPLQKITDISQTKFLSEGQSGTIEEIPSDFSGEERGQLNLIFAEGEYDPLRNFVTRVRFAVDVKTSYTFANFAKLENVTFFPDIEVDPQGYVSFGLDFSADATVKNYKVRVFGSALDMYFSGIATYQDPPTINVDSEFKGGGLPDSARCQYISVTADLKQKSYSASIGLSTNWEPIPGVKLERVQLDVAGSSTGGVTGRIFGTIAIGNVNLNVCGQKGNQGWSIAGEIFPSDQKETREVLKSKFGLTMPDAMGDVGLTRVGLQYNSVGNRLVVEASGGFYFGNTFINTSLSLKKSGSNEWNIIGDLDLFHVNSQGEARSYSFDIEAAKYASGSAIRASWAAETPVTMAEILDAVSVENVPMLDYLPAISGITFTKSSAGAAVKMTGDSWSTVFVTV